MAPWRSRLHEIIFEADTPAGKVFDVALLAAILLSVMAVMLESVEAVDARYHAVFAAAEWVFTILFTLESVLRLLCVGRPPRDAPSFFGRVFDQPWLIQKLTARAASINPKSLGKLTISMLRGTAGFQRR